MDYSLNYAEDPAEYLSLGDAAYLSSFALMNTGDATSWIQREQNRGPWYYDGEIDLGYGGALRTAATIVVNDPDFGWYAYGGDLKRQGNRFAVQSKDGLQQRFHFLSDGIKLGITCAQDGFASQPDAISFDAALSDITLVLENRTGTNHEQELTLGGLPAGIYVVELDGQPLTDLQATSGDTRLTVPVAGESQTYTVRLKRKI
ncbi:MAG TPA: DUF5695 domain-containing protein [Parapedobacter sp.]|nr:DUF5695 domain-containing protein [Parapedobacter sp.]